MKDSATNNENKKFKFESIQVVDGDANMTIAANAFTAERVSFMSHTKSYTENALVFAFTRSEILSTSLWRLMAPFQILVWISVFLLIAISMFLILLSKKLPSRQRHFIIGGRLNRTPIINLINVMIGNVIPNVRMARGHFGVFARSLTILWIFFWLIVRNSYQGALYGFFQTQRNNSPYDTVEKVRNSDVKINFIGPSWPLMPQGFNKKR